MANPVGRTSPIRVEKRSAIVPIARYSFLGSLEEDYGSAESEEMSTSPDTSYRSSADADKSFDLEQDLGKQLIKFDDIIDKIEKLRFSRRINRADDEDDDDNDDGDDEDEDEENEVRRVAASSRTVHNVGYWHTGQLQSSRPTDSEDINNNEDSATTTVDDNQHRWPLNIHDEAGDGEPRHSAHHPDTPSDNSPAEVEDDRDDRDLIERGPVKPDYQPLRGHPYSMVSWLSRVADNADVAHTLDYDKTAEQILKNKEYSDKLNPCLDKLQSNSNRDDDDDDDESVHAIVGGLGMDHHGWMLENDAAYRRNGSRNDSASLPAIVVNDGREEMVNDAGEEMLMDILSHGGFQPAAVLSDTGSHSIPSPGAKTWSDSPASSYNYVVSRPNSRASSRAQSPGSATNLESPQMHVNVIGSPLGSPQVASAYRVPRALSSSSSSNQSYGDAASPCSYQLPLNYQIEEQLGDCFESLPVWKGGYDSSETIVNSTDTIDCGLLQLVEQIIEEDKQQCGARTLKEPQVSCNASYFPSTYNDQRVPAAGTLRDDAKIAAGNAMRCDKSQPRLRLPDVHPPAVVESLIDGSLVSVYTTKESAGGCTFVNRAANGRATCPEPRRYEPRTKNAQIDPTTRRSAALPNVVLNGAVPAAAKASEQSLRASHERYAMFHRAVAGEGGYDASSSSSFATVDYQIPTMVSSFVPSRSQRNPDRGIMPWPSLNLPSVRASERLKEGLHPKEVERAMSNLLKRPLDELAAADEDGDTALMCLVGNPEELARKRAYLAPLVERLGNMQGALSMTNNRGEDALYLAAMSCPEMPYVTGYLAAAMLQKRIDINQRLYHIRGDTLIHSVAARGDSHGDVLAELLALRTLQGNPVFDLSKCNYDGRTALHVAVESHDPAGRGVKSLATTRLLLENGADARVKESKCGDTALHIAVSLCCDPALVKVLLSKATCDVVNETNYMHNTPLHMAAAVSSAVSVDTQKEVCRLLLQAGGHTNIQNRQGKTALALVSPERKEIIRRLFYKKS